LLERGETEEEALDDRSEDDRGEITMKTRATTIAAAYLLTTFLIAGCSKDSSPQSTTGAASAAPPPPSAAAAPTPTGADVSAWIGSWTNGGTQTTTCKYQGTSTAQIVDPVTITAGSTPGTITTNVATCPLSWTVDKNVATIKAGSFCTVHVKGTNVGITWHNAALTLNGNLVTYTNAGATDNNCTFTQQGTMTKM
jgi:hypothetical protein